jgi:methionyl-tRNA formyltransferase
MRIALLCATRRGCRFLERLAQLSPESDFVVASFKEESWEPPFCDDIRNLTSRIGGHFIEARQVGRASLEGFWHTTAIDLMFVVSWRYMIPDAVYRRPRLGTFIFHDSLLPRYRGFAPTVWSIVNGEDHTGVTLFSISEQVDAGDIVDQKRIPIGPDDTIAHVLELVTQGYLELLEGNLAALLAGLARKTPQDERLASYTCKRVPEDGEIIWSWPTDRIYNLVRASGAPYSGAFTHVRGRRLRVWSASREMGGRSYIGRVHGRVVEVVPGVGVVVLTGDGALVIRDVQEDDGPVVCAAEVVKGVSETLGARRA